MAAIHEADLERAGSAADRAVVLKTSSKDMSEELKQLEELTSGTSSGLAKVMSTHWTGDFIR